MIRPAIRNEYLRSRRAIAAATRHAQRHDKTSQRRTADAVQTFTQAERDMLAHPDALLFSGSAYSDDPRDVGKAYDAMVARHGGVGTGKDGDGVKLPKQRKGQSEAPALVSHLKPVLNASWWTLDEHEFGPVAHPRDPRNPRLQKAHAAIIAAVEDAFGADSVLAFRKDFDEAGLSDWDVFIAPVAMSGRGGRIKALSVAAAFKKLTQRYGLPPRDTYEALQTHIHAYLHEHLDSRLERGLSKKETQREHVHADILREEAEKAAEDLTAAHEARRDAEAARGRVDAREHEAFQTQEFYAGIITETQMAWHEARKAEEAAKENAARAEREAREAAEHAAQLELNNIKARVEAEAIARELELESQTKRLLEEEARLKEARAALEEQRVAVKADMDKLTKRRNIFQNEQEESVFTRLSAALQRVASKAERKGHAQRQTEVDALTKKLTDAEQRGADLSEKLKVARKSTESARKDAEQSKKRAENAWNSARAYTQQRDAEQEAEDKAQRQTLVEWSDKIDALEKKFTRTEKLLRWCLGVLPEPILRKAPLTPEEREALDCPRPHRRPGSAPPAENSPR